MLTLLFSNFIGRFLCVCLPKREKSKEKKSSSGLIKSSFVPSLSLQFEIVSFSHGDRFRRVYKRLRQWTSCYANRSRSYLVTPKPSVKRLQESIGTLRLVLKRNWDFLNKVFDPRSFSFADSIEDGPPQPPKSFSLKELRVATHNFSRDNFFRERVCGTLYRGHLADGSPVAVKRARTVFECNEEQFETEVQVGRSVSAHSNVLRLRGFCRTKKELLLVYPFLINKNLRYHLRHRPDRSTQPLSWTTRMRIALGAARGLAHVHNQGNVKIMHRDICTSSIFLNDQFEAVIGNFWRALIMHDGNATEGTIQWPRLKHPVRVSSSSQGEDSADSDSDSPTYNLYEDVYVDTTYADGRVEFIAPEYLHTGKCTLRNDVRAFGKVLLELISGQPSAKLHALANDENLSLEEWMGGLMNKNESGRLIDPNLQGNYVEEEAEQVVRLALLCAGGDPSVRLEMSEVVRMLESQLLGHDHSSSSRSRSECDSTPYHSFPPSPSLEIAQ